MCCYLGPLCLRALLAAYVPQMVENFSCQNHEQQGAASCVPSVLVSLLALQAPALVGDDSPVEKELWFVTRPLFLVLSRAKTLWWDVREDRKHQNSGDHVRVTTHVRRRVPVLFLPAVLPSAAKSKIFFVG